METELDYTHTLIDSIVDDNGLAHDVFLHLKQTLQDLKELLTSPDTWLTKRKAAAQSNGDPSLDGVDSMGGVTLFFRDGVVAPDTCMIEGMPASGALSVTMNLAHYRTAGLPEVLVDLQDWLAEAPITVTLRLDDGSAFVHTEIRSGFDSGRIFFSILTNPDGFGQLLQNRTVKLARVPAGATVPNTTVDFPGKDIRLSLQPNIDLTLMFTVPRKPPCCSCNPLIGRIKPGTNINYGTGEIQGPLSIQFHTMFITNWCPCPKAML